MADEKLTPMDDPSASSTAYVGVVFTLVFVVTLVALIGYFDRVRDEEFEAKVVDKPTTAVRDLRAEQLGELREYRWIDRDAGTVAIPIGRAMDLVVEERGEAPGSGSGS